MLLENIEIAIKTNKRMAKCQNETRFNILINHYDSVLYEKIKDELKNYKLIEVDANELIYDQTHLLGKALKFELSLENKFMSEITDNSILLIKNIEKIEKPQYRSCLLSALEANYHCPKEIADKMRKLLTCIAFIDTDDEKLLYKIKTIDGKDQFIYNNGKELTEN